MKYILVRKGRLEYITATGLPTRIVATSTVRWARECLVAKYTRQLAEVEQYPNDPNYVRNTNWLLEWRAEARYVTIRKCLAFSRRPRYVRRKRVLKETDQYRRGTPPHAERHLYKGWCIMPRGTWDTDN